MKLIDFGIARQGLTVEEESGLRPGKVTYMSPEQVKGAPIDGRSDIFCLGTILYEITLGRRLWRGPRDVASKRIVEERPTPPTFVRHDYPSELELIVLRTLEKKPEDRYQSAAELHNDLHSFLERSGAHLRNNCQMADYVTKIFSEEADALISDAGRKRAQAFVEGGEAAEPDHDDLDFDVQQIEGPGAALARALRTSALGVWADVDNPKAKADASTDADHGGDGRPAEDEPVFAETKGELENAVTSQPSAPNSSPGSGQGDTAEPAEKKEKDGDLGGALAGAANREQGADTWVFGLSSRTITVSVAVFLAAMAGLFLWLRGG